MVTLESWTRVGAMRIGSRFLARERFYYFQSYYHPSPNNFFAPLTLVVGDCIPYGCNLNRQWERAGEDFWLAIDLTQWPDCNYYLRRWEPHP